MDVFQMTYVRNATFHKLKKTAKKHPVYEDKSDTRRKVIKVGGTARCVKYLFPDLCQKLQSKM